MWWGFRGCRPSSIHQAHVSVCLPWLCWCRDRTGRRGVGQGWGQRPLRPNPAQPDQGLQAGPSHSGLRCQLTYACPSPSVQSHVLEQRKGGGRTIYFTRGWSSHSNNEGLSGEAEMADLKRYLLNIQEATS